jgi:hypothetical protein
MFQSGWLADWMDGWMERMNGRWTHIELTRILFYFNVSNQKEDVL